jgi:hypothetical protein
MKTTAVVSLILILAFSAWANEIHHKVERSSDLERELAFRLSIQDKHDVWRADGLDKVFPIKGPAPEHIVRFDATMTGKLKSVFGLTLTLTGADGIVVQVPLALRTKWHKENEVSVKFLISKDMISRAGLTIRCGLPNLEESYSIRLVDYAPKPGTP